MSKLTLTAILAIAVFLIAATVVFAQGSPTGNWGRGSMMQAQGTPGGSTDGTTTTPMGPGNMGNGTGHMNGGQGHMGNGGSMMNDEDRQAMHDAMQNGDWETMQDTCQRIHDERNTGDQPQTTEPTASTTRGNAT